MQRLLTVCVGNICRSPVAEALLQQALPSCSVASAGISAVVGSDIDQTARAVAEANGVSLDQHRARQFTNEIGGTSDLILVLEAGHRREIARLAPQLSGRTFLLSHWNGGQDIPDPYRRSRDFHERVFAQIDDAVASWAKRLSANVEG